MKKDRDSVVSVMSQFVALPFQKVDNTNEKAATLIHLHNGTITEQVQARILMLFVYWF